jgi:beta-lactamase superfamily II metal-dependent hydrolase
VLATTLANLFEQALSYLPVETLGDGGVTHPRNNSSVITLLSFKNKRYMFTGDAGIPALEYAAEAYETTFGDFATTPLTFFQAPHHGSKRNVGKTILNRILGHPSAAHNDNFHGFIHAAKASVKHPSPKVTNALIRRGCQLDYLAVTNGQTKWHHSGSPEREGWSSFAPYPILAEDEE